MEYLLICLISLLVSIVTLFSGFGLGTLLMPIFAFFFPMPVAIASTAIVHLLNNIFKSIIVGKLANWYVVLTFGIPAAFFSAVGAYLLGKISNVVSVASYSIFNHEFEVTVIGVIVGLTIVISSLFELVPKLSHLSFSSKYIPIGAALSGFFGGISGNQGIFRSAVLIKAGLSKEEFIGTSVICSIVVDIVRIIVYGWSMFFDIVNKEMGMLLVAASMTAFLGSYIGAKLIEKVTFKHVQMMVGSMLFFLGIAFVIGLIKT